MNLSSHSIKTNHCPISALAGFVLTERNAVARKQRKRTGTGGHFRPKVPRADVGHIAARSNRPVRVLRQGETNTADLINRHTRKGKGK